MPCLCSCLIVHARGNSWEEKCPRKIPSSCIYNFFVFVFFRKLTCSTGNLPKSETQEFDYSYPRRDWQMGERGNCSYIVINIYLFIFYKDGWIKKGIHGLQSIIQLAARLPKLMESRRVCVKPCLAWESFTNLTPPPNQCKYYMSDTVLGLWCSQSKVWCLNNGFCLSDLKCDQAIF